MTKAIRREAFPKHKAKAFAPTASVQSSGMALNPYQAYLEKARVDSLARARKQQAAQAGFDYAGKVAATNLGNAAGVDGSYAGLLKQQAASRQFGVDENKRKLDFDTSQARDETAYQNERADADYAERQRSLNQQAPQSEFTPTAAPQSAIASSPDAATFNTPKNAEAQRRATYIAAQTPQQAPPATRNNFHGAENAPDGAVVRGLDRMLYRRTGGNFVRVPPRSADDFDPTLNPQSTLGGADARLKANQQTRFDADVAQFGLGIANRNRQNAGLNGPTAQPDNGQPIGAISNQPNDATAVGLANKKHLDESLATSAYDYEVKQDELHDARVRAAASSSGSYLDMNRRSPRFGSRVNWFDPGEVNPAALAPKRPKPQFAL